MVRLNLTLARFNLSAVELSRSAALKPDVVVTDIEMPRMTGLELAAELRQRVLLNLHH